MNYTAGYSCMKRMYCIEFKISEELEKSSVTINPYKCFCAATFQFRSTPISIFYFKHFQVYYEWGKLYFILKDFTPKALRQPWPNTIEGISNVYISLTKRNIVCTLLTNDVFAPNTLISARRQIMFATQSDTKCP